MAAKAAPGGRGRGGRGGDDGGSSGRKHVLSPHVPKDQDSLLTKSEVSVETFEGFINLGMIFLFSATAQLCVYNYRHRGVLVDWRPLLCMVDDALAAVVVAAMLAVISYAGFVLAAAQARGWLNASAVMAAYVAVQSLMIGISIDFAYFGHPSPPVAAAFSLTAIILMLKLHSYVRTNSTLAYKKAKARKAAATGEAASQEPAVDKQRLDAYPKNLTLKDFTYFLVVPSLVYEPVFPRRDRIRWMYAAKELAAMLLCLLAVYILGLQFVLPALRDDALAYQEKMKTLRTHSPIKLGGKSESWLGDLRTAHFVRDLLGVMLRSCYEVMHLSLPSMTLWLTGSYAFFHCFLNFLAEITRFADRRFYLDWWNAVTLEEFWRKWNIPVHEWMHRHVFLESLKFGKSKFRATLLTFVVSAIMHEFALILTFQVIEIWFFAAMVLQVPLILITKVLRNRRLGNTIMWFSLFIGQPLLELFYVRQYTLEYPSSLTQGACAVDFWTAHDPLQWPQRLTQMLTAYWQ